MSLPGAVIRTTRISSSRQLIEQRLRLLQVGGVEAFGKPAIDRGDEVAGFGAPALLAPQPGEIADGAQFQRFCLLGLRDADRLLKGSLALVELIFGEQHGPGEAVEFRIPPMLAGGASYFQSLL